MNFLKEHIDLQVAIVLQEKLRGGFDFNKFKALPSHRARIRYASHTLDALGCGSSKCAWILSSGKVLKMSTYVEDSSDLLQNKTEIENFHTLGSGLVPKVFENAPDYTWYTAEPVRTFKDKREFKEITGIDSDQIRRFGDLIAKIGMELLPTPRDVWMELNKKWGEHISEWENLPEKGRELLEKVYELESKGIIDIARWDHWGWGADGRLLCVDTGIKTNVRH